MRGFSLLEVIGLIVVVSVALAGILLVYSNSVRGSADPAATKQALAAAEALLEEIQLGAFCNPAGGFDDGNPAVANQADRVNFDDVDDYNGFSTVGLYAIDGVAPISGLGAYNASATVVPSALSSIGAADAKLITVTVTGPVGQPNAATITLSGYRADLTAACP